ncbi:MAG: hypothetical protein E6Q97_28910 [Desulfurellales bacterium]|nr:MAG: hypothetical protein E6Q97_28910 [Desulfurellales bacterium]
MPRDVALFSTYYPQAGDSTEQTLKRLLARAVRPAEDAVIYLASAARLGTTAGTIIDTRGYEGILINLYITAVAGAGTMRISLYSNSNILMSTTSTRIAESAFVTSSLGMVTKNGLSIPAVSTAYTCQGLPLGRYSQIVIQNSSVTPGDEVTAEVSYILL